MGIKLLKTRLEKYITIRVLALSLVLSVLDLVFVENKYPVLIGIMLGTLIGLLRFKLMSTSIAKLLMDTGKDKNTPRKGILGFVLNQLFIVLLLLLTVLYDKWLFFGMVAGTLSVSFIATGYGFLHALGISKDIDD